jgi:hypothetical protein
MATNTIALLARPVEIDPFEVPAKKAALRSLANKHAAEDIELQTARQGIADDQAARAALAADPTGGEGYLKGLATAGNVKGYFAGVKANADVAKTRAEAGKDQAAATKQQLEAINLRTARYRDALGNVNDSTGAADWVRAMYSDPELGPIIAKELGPVESALGRIPADPQGFAAWKRGSQLGAEKLVEITKPVVGSRNLGDRVEATLTDPTTGRVTVTGTARVGTSPDTAARVAQDERQSLRTDSRERELNPGSRPQYDPTRGVLVDARTGTARPVMGPNGQPLAPRAAMTEFQGKSAVFGDRAAEADRIISGLQGKYSPAAINSKVSVEGVPLVGGMLGAATNYALSAEDQQAEQAQRDFINAVLRQESGAAIGASEFDNARKQYFPQPNDKPENIAQKANNRRLAVAGLQRNAGPSYQQHNGAAPAAPGAPATNANGWALHVDAAGNRAYVSPDGSQFEEVQ